MGVQRNAQFPQATCQRHARRRVSAFGHKGADEPTGYYFWIPVAQEGREVQWRWLRMS